MDNHDTSLHNLVEVKYKDVLFNCKFEFEGIEYKKTNFNRGFYHKKGSKIFKTFKKSKIVKTSREFFDVLPLTK